MQIDERLVGDVKILDLTGTMTLGEGDELLRDKVNSLVHRGISIALYGPYIIGVELASMLLLPGLIGAYHLGRRLSREGR